MITLRKIFQNIQSKTWPILQCVYVERCFRQKNVLVAIRIEQNDPSLFQKSGER